MVVEKKLIHYWVYPGMVNRPKVISIEKLFNCIELKLGVTKEQLICPVRKREYVDARHMFALFLRRNTNLSTTRVGKLLNRDHSTVVYSVKTGYGLYQSDKQFKSTYKELEDMLINDIFMYNDTEFEGLKIKYVNNRKEKEPIKIV